MRAAVAASVVALALAAASAAVAPVEDGLIAFSDTQYVFDNPNDSGAALCGVGLNGDTEALLPFRNDGEYYLDAAWSPHGTRLAVENAGIDPSVPGVDVFGPRKPDDRVRGVYGGEAAWSPDGKQIAVATARDVDGFPLDGPFHIAVFTPGVHAQTLVTHGAGELWPSWSPDGKQIAYQRATDAGGIVVHDLATGAERGVGTLGDLQPEWSPDGKRILVTNAGELFTIDPGDGTRRDLHLRGSYAIWSPSGTRIAYLASPSGGLMVSDLRTHSKVVLSISADRQRMSWQRRGPSAYRPGFPDCPDRLEGAPIPVRQGTERADRIVRLHGPQWIEARSGDDRVVTGAGADRVEGDQGNDTLRTGGGNDYVDGGPGADFLDGGSGRDSLHGGPGPDRIVGGPGDDSIFGRDGAHDRISCGPGHDDVVADPVDVVAKDCEDVTIAKG